MPAVGADNRILAVNGVQLFGRKHAQIYNGSGYHTFQPTEVLRISVLMVQVQGLRRLYLPLQ